jgi:hypothetical protein
VYQRFTSSVDPSHLQPWSFYLAEIDRWLRFSGTATVVAAGTVLIAFQAAARRRFEAAIVLIWAALPVLLISLGSSKLYHYEYPFLPPLAIAGGVGIAAAIPLVERWLRTALEPLRGRGVSRPTLRTTCAALAIVAFAVAIATLLFGPIELSVAGFRLFKNGGLVRPAAVMVVAALAAGQVDLLRRLAVPVIALAVLPLHQYRELLPYLRNAPHPLRSTSACIADVQRGSASRLRVGLFVDATDEDLVHPPHYYFRRIRPWERVHGAQAPAIAQNLDPGVERPALISSARYRELVAAGAIPSTVARADFPHLVLLLPGPYAACVAGAQRKTGS